jgi:hypothetical protein
MDNVSLFDFAEGLDAFIQSEINIHTWIFRKESENVYVIWKPSCPAFVVKVVVKNVSSIKKDFTGTIWDFFEVAQV